MPLDDAMAFVSRNYSGQVEASSGPKQGGGGHPEDILNILGFLTDNRPLSVVEYDKILRYLNTRRTEVLKAEYGETIPPALAIPPLLEPKERVQQEQLQTKVLAILQRKEHRPPAPSAAPVSQGLAPGLQAAIDSLVKTGPNLLNSLKRNNSVLDDHSSLGYQEQGAGGWEAKRQEKEVVGGWEAKDARGGWGGSQPPSQASGPSQWGGSHPASQPPSHPPSQSSGPSQWGGSHPTSQPPSHPPSQSVGPSQQWEGNHPAKPSQWGGSQHSGSHPGSQGGW